jgi:hypothetical protein
VRGAGRLAPLAATFLLGIAGLVLPGAAGDVPAFVWLGVFPGLALARLLLPAAPAGTRWTLGLALSPLAASVAGWVLLRAGNPLPVAARIVALGGWILFAAGESRSLAGGERSGADAPGDRAAWAWGLAAALFVALPLFVDPWTRFRSDTWVHTGIVFEISERGVPPQDPRFAGLPLNYVWFYNLFIALLDALREPLGGSPFTNIAVANLCWMATQVALGWQLAWSIWRERAAARATLPLLLLGLNAGTLLLWPLWFVRAFIGDVTGWDEVHRILRNMPFGTVDVMRQLGAPFAYMVNSWDKYMLGTAIGYAWLLMLVLLWAAARWFEPGASPATPPSPAADAGREAGATERGDWRWLGVAFAAAAGTMLFHSVVGLSVIPVSLGACVLYAAWARMDPTLGPSRRPMLFAGALVLGLLVTWPYFRSIVAGWSPDRSGVRHEYLRLHWAMPWTLLSACGVAAWAAWAGAVRAIAERRRAALWLLAWTLGMTAFACVVHLPQNNEHKFVWQVLVPLAVLGGPGFPVILAGVRRRLGTPLAAMVGVLAFVLPSLLLLDGFLRDPSGRTAYEMSRAPGERELYDWVRTHTPANAVFTDFHARDVLLVEGRRRLFVGTARAPDVAAFPSDQMAHRRAVVADLYGPARELEADAACLDSLGAPAYLLFRAEDFTDAVPWTALEADSGQFQRVYADAFGHRVYRRRPR